MTLIMAERNHQSLHQMPGSRGALAFQSGNQETAPGASVHMEDIAIIEQLLLQTQRMPTSVELSNNTTSRESVITNQRIHPVSDETEEVDVDGSTTNSSNSRLTIDEMAKTPPALAGGLPSLAEAYGKLANSIKVEDIFAAEHLQGSSAGHRFYQGGGYYQNYNVNQNANQFHGASPGTSHDKSNDFYHNKTHERNTVLNDYAKGLKKRHRTKPYRVPPAAEIAEAQNSKPEMNDVWNRVESEGERAIEADTGSSYSEGSDTEQDIAGLEGDTQPGGSGGMRLAARVLGTGRREGTRCHYCPKRFETEHLLNEHLSYCVSARPHDCAQCGKRFKTRAGLDQHNRIHSQHRPYTCHFCTKTFIQKCHLDQHERIHTGVKPYVCNFCGRAFRQKSGQQQHEMTHLK